MGENRGFKMGGVKMRGLAIRMIWLVVLGLALLGGQAWSQDARPYHLDVKVGGSINNYGDNPTRAAEYKSQVDMNSTWYLNGEFGLDYKDILMSITGHYINGDNQDYSGSLDFKRLFYLGSDYHRFYHWLDRDLLENFPGGSLYGGSHEKAHYRDGSRYYGITHSLWKNKALLRLPFFPGTVVGFTHRMQERKGWDQVTTVGKCYGCHVVGYSRRVKEYTNDYIPYIETHVGPFTMNYKFMYRTFNTSDDVPFFHDTSRTVKSGTEGRLLFNPNTDTVPLAVVPKSRKWQHTVKAKWNISPSQLLDVGFVYSEVTDKSSDESYGGSRHDYGIDGDFGKELDVDYLGFSGNWYWHFARGLSLIVRAKYDNIDADDVYVPLPPYSDAPPNDTTDNGINYSFNRKSAYDRDEFILTGDLYWRYSPEWFFRLGYKLYYLDRNNADAYDITKDTTEHLFKIGVTWRPTPLLKIKADYHLLYVSNPYYIRDASCPEANAPEDYIPLGDDSVYSKALYSNFRADMTNQPKWAHDAEVKVDYTPSAKLYANLYLKYRYARNDEDTDYYDWEQDSFRGGIGVTYTPMDKFGLSVGYNLLYDEYTSMLATNLFAGGGNHVMPNIFEYPDGTVEKNVIKCAHDEVDWENLAHVFYLNVSSTPIKKLDLSATLNYTYAEAEMDSPDYPNIKIYKFHGKDQNGNPIFEYEFNPSIANNADDYSDLDYSMIGVEASASYSILDNLSLTLDYEYSDFIDVQPYVYGDLDGDAYTLTAFLSWKF